MTKSAYIHIPFCRRKCNYCTFVSYEQLTLKNIYIDSLIKEIRSNYKGELLNTIYFGGGTPSILSPNDFQNILSELKFDAGTEITVELNPENVTKNYLEDLKATGVNRLSIGIQDFNNKILKNIGRMHTSEDAELVIKMAQDVGFSNISIDLIYGLPAQTEDMFIHSLKKAISLDIQHISLYGLKIEEGCKFYNHKPDFLPDDDSQADYYLKAIEICKENGFEHYEISNFSKSGYHSKHNLNYWNNEHYYGFGVAASGYEENTRYYNEKNIEKYIQNPFKKDHEDILTKQQKLEEEIFLGFRRMQGINTKKINEKFDIDFEKKYESVLKKYSKQHIEKTPNGYKLNNNGILVSNVILSEFI